MKILVQVCTRCAKIKQRCDGGNPCSRCARLGHICDPQTPARKSDPGSSQVRRPRASRSRAGCLSCKARKKKCDEVRPRCSDCRRLDLPCRWADPNSPSQNVSDMTGPDPATHESADQGSPSDQITNSSPSTVTDPTFASNIEVWLAEKLPVSPPGTGNPYLHNDEDRSLFNHYLHIVARALSRSAEPATNPFLTTLLPMAAGSDTLTSVLLGLSGCHWRRIYPSIWKRALVRQGQAISQVNRLLAQSDGPCILETAVTVLLLCLTELCDGSSRVWKWHLKAARTLLASGGTSALEKTTEGTFCLNLFHYFDSMSTISRCKPPLLHQGNSLADLTTNPQPTFTTSSAEPIGGMAPALLDLLGIVNLLAAHRSRRVDDLSEIGFRTAAASVQDQLDTWRASYNESLRDEETVYNRDAEWATTAFEWAVRLRLHQIVEGYDPRHGTVETAIEQILQAALSIPYGSPVEGSLLFPLIIAGASSTETEERMVVKERLIVMENTLGFGHIPRARELLEVVWAEKESNWARVRYSQFPGVVFI